MQMRRFELLGATSEKQEEPKLEERPIEPSEEEKAIAQERRRQEKMKQIFSGIGNGNGKNIMQPEKKKEETDEDLLFSGLKGTY